jgi:hypothetical protein
MEKKLELICKNLDWVFEMTDALQARINDYIFESGCDINPTAASAKKLKAFERECNELEMRFDKEIRELEKLAGNE